MLENLAWTLQVLALVIVGTGLLVGVAYDQVRVELGMLGVGRRRFPVRPLARDQEPRMTGPAPWARPAPGNLSRQART